MQPINLIGGFYKDDALPWSVQDTVNLLPVAAEVDGTRTPTKLRTPPGLRPFVNIGDGPDYAIRGMHDVEGALFVVSGSRLYRISNTGVAIPCGTIPGVGRVSMAHNQITGGNELLVVNGDAGYVWNTVTETFARVSDEGYPGAFIADYIDSYLAQVEPFGRYWFHSDLADAMSYNTLDRAESEAAPDRIVSLLSAHLEVWVFGERTIEVFENVGAGTGTFQNKRVAIEHGCAGRFTPAKLDNGIFWLGNDGVVYRANGYQPQRISTHAIERAIADSDWSQAFAFTWSDRGHAVYYLTFPDGQTWGYDVSSGLWHRRATYHPQHDVARRWRLNDLVYSNRQWIGGDYRDGKLYALDWDYVLEGEGDPLVRERVAQVLQAEQRRFSVNEVELVMETGGPRTEPVMFAVPPIGPSISGDAPGGYIAQSYSYQYLIEEGDAPIERVTAADLPSGWEISRTGLLTGPALVANRFSFIVRVVDTNGLWSELQDEISIEPMLVGFVNYSNPDYYYLWRTPALFDGEVQWARDALPIVSSSQTQRNMMASDIDIFFSNGPGPYRNMRVPGPLFLSSEHTYQDMDMSPYLIKDYGDGILIGFEKQGAAGPLGRYMLSDNHGASWTVHRPNGLRISDIERLNSGRWVSHYQLGSDRRLLTSDGPLPTSFVETPFAGWTPLTNQEARFGCTGEWACLLCSDGFVRRTRDGITYQTTALITGLPNLATRGWKDGVVAIAVGNKLHVSTDHGLTFPVSEEVYPPTLGANIWHIDRAGDRLIVMSDLSSAEAGMGAYSGRLGQDPWVVIPRPPGYTSGVGSIAVIGEPL